MRRVLIVTKTTNFELHGPSVEARVAEGRVPSDALDRLRRAHAEHYETLARLKVALNAKQVAFELVSREAERPLGGADAVITVGGDGTLLSASHQLGADALVFGVRSSESSVGFLCAAGPKDPERLVDALVTGRFATFPASRLLAVVRQAETGEEVRTIPILNDFLFTNANPAATTRYRLNFGGTAELQRSSGLWIATGVGSTAAILAAGGERRPHDERRFQFKVRELYRLGHPTPTVAGALFDPDHEPLLIENRCPQALLAMDGQHGVMELKYGDTIRFERATAIRLALPLS